MSDIDLKAYFFGELPEDERRRIAAHLETDPAARAELSRLEATQSMLGFVQDEELPRRIAFVSDKVFEPNWWHRFWASGAQLGFASAALLALAVVGHGWLSRPIAAPLTATVDAAVVRAVVVEEMGKRVQAVNAPVSGVDAAATSKLIAVALKEVERRAELDRAADRLTIEENFNFLRRLMSNEQVASYQRPVRN